MININYTLEDAIKTLGNIKSNHYGIKDNIHAFDRAQQRDIDINIVMQALSEKIPVGIEKTYNESSKFELLYPYTKFNDLCIVINILNEEEIEVITIMEKNVSRRKH